MVHVIATITVQPGTRDEFLKLFKENIPAVLAEDGCLAYEPTTDSGFEGEPRPDVTVIVERWESPEHLAAHLEAPHMVAFRENAGHLIAGLDLAVLEPA